VLSIIHGYADVLGQDLSAANRGSFDFDGALHSAQTIKGAADRAAALTSQLLAFSRRQVVKSQVLGLNASIAAIEPMLTQLIGRSISLVLKLDPAAGNIRADPGQIDQIVVNLVVNARDAMPDGGTVTIETAQAGGQAGGAAAESAGEAGRYAVVIVSDTGLGMDRATRERAFEPFFTTKGAGKGTGLGLATTHGIVTRAGGRISLESEPGHGSTFRLSFPRIDAAPDALSQSRPAADVTGAGRILLVEAETELRDVMTQLLRRAGYDVLAVADGAQAVALATLPGRFDALVTDVDLPNPSGLELAEWMMAHNRRAGVVLVSGYVPEAFDLDRLMAAGAKFAPKPITSARLLDAVRDAVASRGPLEA
jgi:CheY-like chemotaxis protein/anti-sigma regulatory factor (Ser/Thr protein kinase)